MVRFMSLGVPLMTSPNLVLLTATGNEIKQVTLSSKKIRDAERGIEKAVCKSRVCYRVLQPAPM